MPPAVDATGAAFVELAAAAAGGGKGGGGVGGGCGCGRAVASDDGSHEVLPTPVADTNSLAESPFSMRSGAWRRASTPGVGRSLGACF